MSVFSQWTVFWDFLLILLSYSSQNAGILDYVEFWPKLKELFKLLIDG